MGLVSAIQRAQKKVLYKIYLLKNSKKVINGLKNWDRSIASPREFYLDTFRFFYKNLPEDLKNHKEYFKQEKRGFGEDAFHVMWYMLFKKFYFSNFLEIGVYRGQVMSLIALLAKLENREVDITGISPFNKSGDSVSKYVDINYIEDINQNFQYFKLKKPQLISAYSTDSESLGIISSKIWDCIYIDGSHDYEIVKQDWDNCSKNIKVGGLIIIDDSSLFTNYDNPFFSFKGHPGPSKVADEVDMDKFREILRVGHNRVFERIK